MIIRLIQTRFLLMLIATCALNNYVCSPALGQYSCYWVTDVDVTLIGSPVCGKDQNDGKERIITEVNRCNTDKDAEVERTAKTSYEISGKYAKYVEIALKLAYEESIKVPICCPGRKITKVMQQNKKKDCHQQVKVVETKEYYCVAYPVSGTKEVKVTTETVSWTEKWQAFYGNSRDCCKTKKT